MSKDRDPRVTTWADGWGVWHARVPRNAAGPLLAARRVIRDEILEREPGADRAAWSDLDRVPSLDTPDTIVYREGER